MRIGLARDSPRFSGGRYREVEQAAADQGATIRCSTSCRRSSSAGWLKSRAVALGLLLVAAPVLEARADRDRDRDRRSTSVMVPGVPEGPALRRQLHQRRETCDKGA